MGRIPAHAGKTHLVDAGLLQARAHPRSRGENEIEALLDPEQQGASPLTRGKRSSMMLHAPKSGRIPAHAGKTGRCHRLSGRLRAHPRSRGENLAQLSPAVASQGASPLTRGKPQARREGQRGHGRIPAHAGKTPRPCLRRALAWAHPRSRGENDATAGLVRTHRGASPLTRGKPRMRHRATPDRGRIPAHAGKTLRGLSLLAHSWAHPRSRGENQGDRIFDRSDNGASPLTRGKPQLQATRRDRRGRIPAHAGKTLPDLRFYRADRSDLGKP